ncbi:SCY1-like protein 2 isoform X2 [Eurytemora carolleeae]|uniref:SCY1-like protein 2 isoform X2 n=1 Tax=Eurytemora carolleeae TaxID=1294199 RepID=UPI000C759A2B|nr:SCY1-like protein 2 isoform X2 [Eurytemora carolleeae]|eukprot:XP_023332600.1 SCY1-like protein 2 isoform X2 [Eurytemora affinis]
MFTKQKTGLRIIESNPIAQYYSIGRQLTCPVPEPDPPVWKIYDAVSKADGKEASIHVYEKKGCDRVGRGKRREAIAELLKEGVTRLVQHSAPRILQVLHGPEENGECLAFASERVLGTLSTILVSQHMMESSNPVAKAQINGSTEGSVYIHYNFIDFEYRYGLCQITEALLFLHASCQLVHRNVCPGTIYISSRGTWKLGGLEHAGRIGNGDCEVACQPWTTKMPKAAQPNLNYIAPEIQHKSCYNSSSDMYSLGMTYISCFNSGQSVIQASHSTSQYFKLAGQLSEKVAEILPFIPVGLQELVNKLVNQDTRHRPTARQLVQAPYFGDPAVQALQFLETLNTKDTNQKAQFFRNSLIEVFPFIPRKLWLQQIWPILDQELNKQEVMAAVLESALFLIRECSQQEYQTFIQSSIRPIFNGPKTVQASVTLLEQLPILLEKTNQEELDTQILPMVYLALESNMSQVQMAAVSVVPAILDYLCDDVIRTELLPRARNVYSTNGADVKIVLSLLACIAKILDKLDRAVIIDEVLPLLYDIRLNDINILVTVLEIYRVMLSDRRYGLNMTLLATRVLPVLIPQCVNPQLSIDNYMIVHGTIQEMMDHIDRHQRNKLKLEGDLPKSVESLRLRSDRYSDVSIPNLVIRRPSVVQGHFSSHSSALSRLSAISSNNSSGDSSPENNNYLRVSAMFGNRRWSENTLPVSNRSPLSSVSSPGSAPGSPVGLPNRRHSSATQRRRSSSNLLIHSTNPTSPVLFQLGGSVPNSLGKCSPVSSRRSSRVGRTGSSSSLVGSRKPSLAGVGEWPNSPPSSTPSLLQTIGNNVCSLLGRH